MPFLEPINGSRGTKDDMFGSTVWDAFTGKIFSQEASNKFLAEIDIYRLQRVPEEQKMLDQEGEIESIYEVPLRMPVPKQYTNGILIKIRNISDMNKFFNLIKALQCGGACQYKYVDGQTDSIQTSYQFRYHYHVVLRLVSENLLHHLDPMFPHRNEPAVQMPVLIKLKDGHNLNNSDRRFYSNNPAPVIESPKLVLQYNPHLPFQKVLDHVSQLNTQWNEGYRNITNEMQATKQPPENLDPLLPPDENPLRPNIVYRGHEVWCRKWTSVDQFQVRKKEKEKFNKMGLRQGDVLWAMASNMNAATAKLDNVAERCANNSQEHRILSQQIRHNHSTSHIQNIRVPAQREALDDFAQGSDPDLNRSIDREDPNDDDEDEATPPPPPPPGNSDNNNDPPSGGAGGGNAGGSGGPPSGDNGANQDHGMDENGRSNDQNGPTSGGQNSTNQSHPTGNQMAISDMVGGPETNSNGAPNCKNQKQVKFNKSVREFKKTRPIFLPFSHKVAMEDLIETVRELDIAEEYNAHLERMDSPTESGRGLIRPVTPYSGATPKGSRILFRKIGQNTPKKTSQPRKYGRLSVPPVISMECSPAASPTIPPAMASTTATQTISPTQKVISGYFQRSSNTQFEKSIIDTLNSIKSQLEILSYFNLESSHVKHLIFLFQAEKKKPSPVAVVTPRPRPKTVEKPDRAVDETPKRKVQIQKKELRVNQKRLNQVTPVKPSKVASDLMKMAEFSDLGKQIKAYYHKRQNIFQKTIKEYFLTHCLGSPVGTPKQYQKKVKLCQETCLNNDEEVVEMDFEYTDPKLRLETKKRQVKNHIIHNTCYKLYSGTRKLLKLKMELNENRAKRNRPNTNQDDLEEISTLHDKVTQSKCKNIQEKIAFINSNLVNEEIIEISQANVDHKIQTTISSSSGRIIKLLTTQPLSFSSLKFVGLIKFNFDCKIPTPKHLYKSTFIIPVGQMCLPALCTINLKNFTNLDESIICKPVELWSNREFRQIAHYVDCHLDYYQSFLTSLGQEQINLWKEMLVGLVSNSNRKEGDELSEEEKFFPSDVIDDEKVKLMSHLQRESGIDNIPTLKIEEEAIERMKGQGRDILARIRLHRNEWAKKYRLTHDLKQPFFSPNFKKRKDRYNRKIRKNGRSLPYSDPDNDPESKASESDHSEIENGRQMSNEADENSSMPDLEGSLIEEDIEMDSIGESNERTIQIRKYSLKRNRPNDNEPSNQPSPKKLKSTEYTQPYHYWLDGSRIDLQRNPHPKEFFEPECSRILTIDRPRSQIQITYVNIPWQKIRYSNENYFAKIIDTFPCSLIFALVELRWTEDSYTVTPPGWTLITHEDLEQKNTAFLIHESVNVISKNCEKNMTELVILTDKNEKISLLAFYRCPTDDQDIYQLLYPGQVRGHMKFYYWMSEKIQSKLSQNQTTFIFLDANIDLYRQPQHQVEQRAQDELRKLFEERWPNLLQGEVTFYRGQSQSSVDWILTNHADSVTEVQKWDRWENSDISDHVIFTVKLREQIRGNPTRKATVKSKIPIHYSYQDKIKYVEPVNTFIKEKQREEIYILMENDMIGWDGSEPYLEDEELPEDIFIQRYGILLVEYKRKRLIWRKLMENRLSVIKEASESLLPMKTIYIAPLGHYIKQDADVKKAIQARRDYLNSRRIQGTGWRSSINNRRLQKLNKDVNIAQKTARYNHWNRKLVDENTSKGFWHVYKEYKNKNETNPVWFNREGIAQAFHDLSWGYTPKNLPTPEWKDELEEGTDEKFDFGTFSCSSQNFFQNPEKMLKNGKGSKYCYSTDGLTWDLVRFLDPWCWKYQTMVFNEIFKTGCYPKSFREQKMLALKKKPVPTSYKQYRPVAVSEQFANNSEQMVCTKYYKWAEEVKKFDDKQFGFRAHYSIGYLISEMRKMLARREKGWYSILLTDLSNAFGSPDTEIVLEEFQKGLSKAAFKMMKSFLIQGRGCLKHDGEYAKTFTGAPRGFSQGSKFSPTAFVIMMSVVHSDVQSPGCSFADDATFLDNVHNEDDLANSIMKTLAEFDKVCESKNMPLNVSKGEYLTNLGKNLGILYKNQPLPHARKTKILGFRMTEHLGHNPQITYIIKSVPTTNHMIRGFGRYITERHQGVVIQSNSIGLSNHASAYDYKWHKNQYQSYQIALNKVMQRRSGWAAYLDAKHNRITDQTKKRRILRTVNRVFESRMAENGPTSILLPVYYLLERNGLMSVHNIHRSNHMSRCATIFATARPHKEYDDFVELIIDPIRATMRRRRRGADFPYFRSVLRRDQTSVESLIKRTSPTINIMEFRRNRRLFGRYLGDKRLINIAKNHYKSRCQHAEWGGSYICPNCNEPVDKWDNDETTVVRHETIDAISNWNHMQVIQRNGQWCYEPILDENITEETILATDIENHIFTSSARALINNLSVTRLFAELHEES